MSEQINAGHMEERETPASGLLLSVEPLQASAQLDAAGSDGNADTGGAGEKDTSDDATSDADTSDGSGADTDMTDALGAGTDNSDSDSSDSDASITIDSKNA